MAPPTIPELLRRYAAGERAVQTALLEEFEPLVFGYARSLVPSGPGAFERAVAATHAVVLGFHLRARAGGAKLANLQELRATAHRLALQALASAPPPLGPVADPETNSLVPTIHAVSARIDARLDAKQCTLLAARLLGEPVEAASWAPIAERLQGHVLLKG